MAISNVKSALATDLATITVANGYNTTIDTVFKVPKFLKDVDPTKLPAFSVFLTNAPAKEFDEANIGCDLIFTIIAYTFVEQDIDETGDLEIALFKMYEDVIKLFNSMCSTQKLDEVQGIEVIDFFPELSGNRGWAFIPIKIIYNG